MDDTKKINYLGKDNILEIGDERIALSIDGDQFEEFNYKMSKLSKNKSFFTNDIAGLFFLKRYFPLKKKLQEFAPNKISISKVTTSNVILLSVIKNLNVSVSKNLTYYLLRILNACQNLKSIILFCNYYFLTIGYFLKKNDFSTSINSDSLAFVRSKASFKKLSMYSIYSNINLTYIVDDINLDGLDNRNDKYYSVYNCVSKKYIFNNFFKLLYYSIREYRLLLIEFKEYFGKKSLIEIKLYASKRITHTVLIKLILTSVIGENQWLKNFYSGDRDDRFSVIQNRICKKFNITSVCVPHGLAFGLKYPHGLFGDKYYAFSLGEKKALKKLYNDNSGKFIFDKEYIELLYRSKNSKKKNLVYFTDSRDVELDRNIIKSLFSRYPELLVKLHPNDIADNYSNTGAKFISNFEEAIQGNIVIARNSSVLLEAVYSNSVAISILLNDRDLFNSNYLYPALKDKSIKKIYSIKELTIKIDKYYG